MAVDTDARERFIAALETGGRVDLAAAASRIGRKTVYRWRERDEAFRVDWDAALARHDLRCHAVWTKAVVSGNWQAARDKLRWRDDQRKATLERALIREQTRQTRLRSDGALPAEQQTITLRWPDEHVEPVVLPLRKPDTDANR